MPNSAIAWFARSVGLTIDSNPLAVACSASCASGPPCAILFDISSAFSPIAVYASTDVFDISEPRIVNSFSASPVLSSANLPFSAAATSMLNDVSPSNPSARKFVPYWLRISGSSPRMAAGTRWNAAVIRSNASVEFFASPFVTSWLAVCTDSPMSVLKTCANVSPIFVALSSDCSPSVPSVLNELDTDPTASATVSMESPKACLYTFAVVSPYCFATSGVAPRLAARLSLITSKSIASVMTFIAAATPKAPAAKVFRSPAAPLNRSLRPPVADEASEVLDATC